MKITVKKSVPIVRKDAKKRIVYGPINIPDEPDYDGDISTAEEIEDYMISYSNYQGVDREHIQDGVGHTFSLYQSKEDTVELLDGQEIIYPTGTLFGGVKIEDENTWKEIEEDKLKGFSPTYLPRQIAGHKTQDILQGNIEITEEIEKEIEEVMSSFEGTGPNGRITIKDLKEKFKEVDMVSIGLVSNPAVSKSFFSAKKSKDLNLFDKLMRVIKSPDTSKKLEDVIDNLNQELLEKEGGDNEMKELLEAIKSLQEGFTSLSEKVDSLSAEKSQEEENEETNNKEEQEEENKENNKEDNKEDNKEENKEEDNKEDNKEEKEEDNKEEKEEDNEEENKENEEIEELKKEIKELKELVNASVKSRGLKNGYEEEEEVKVQFPQRKIRRDLNGVVISED